MPGKQTKIGQRHMNQGLSYLEQCVHILLPARPSHKLPCLRQWMKRAKPEVLVPKRAPTMVSSWFSNLTVRLTAISQHFPFEMNPTQSTISIVQEEGVGSTSLWKLACKCCCPSISWTTWKFCVVRISCQIAQRLTHLVF